MQKETLDQHCILVGKALGIADDWLADNKTALGLDPKPLHKTLIREVARANRLGRAAERKMCAGVFGPSQSGKSYLISVLARPQDQPLMARFGEDRVDFIECINPPGGQESTGVVTRFTLDVESELPPGHSVEVELLTEPDLVCLLANSYAYDVDHDEEGEGDHDPAHIANALDALEQGAHAAGRLSETDVLELEDYCNRRLIRAPRIKVLRACGFWDRAAALIHRLDDSGRARLFSLIWNGISVYNELFQRLQGVLRSLEFSERVFCAGNSLYARSGEVFQRLPPLTSIVDVGTLKGLTEDEVSDSVSVLLHGGNSVLVPRGLLTALISELRVVMEKSPHPLFQHTDLLDFPGARSRQSRPIERLTQNTGATEELFLRGKVAYLFDCYCNRLELTSLLLCAGPENLEVVGLPDLINEWVTTTHGPDPKSRTKYAPSLFFILTKFDMSLAQGAGKSEDAERWIARLNTSLIKAYGGQFRWPSEWAPDRAFDNLFCLRNPNIRQDALFDYASEKGLREKGIRADKRGFLDRLRNSFISCELVRRHFSDPLTAWDAVMAINDGGVDYLIRRLAPLCEPSLKAAQIHSELRSITESILQHLSPYYVSDDLTAEREKKAAQMLKVSRTLAGIVQTQRFGELMRALQVDENDIYDVYLLAGEEYAKPPNVESETIVPVPTLTLIGQNVDADDLLADIFGEEAESSVTTDDDSSVSVPKSTDAAERFARAIERHWRDRLTVIREDPALQRYLLVAPDDAVTLAVELTTGASRLRLFEKIAEEVRQAALYREHRHEAAIWRQVALACTRLNEYVAWLGWGGPEHPEGTAIEYRGKSRHLFRHKGRLTDDGYPDLEEAPTPYSKNYCADWIFALAKHAEDNLARRDQGNIDPEQNRRLGACIEQLRTVLSTEPS